PKCATNINKQMLIQIMGMLRAKHAVARHLPGIDFHEVQPRLSLVEDELAPSLLIRVGRGSTAAVPSAKAWHPSEIFGGHSFYAENFCRAAAIVTICHVMRPPYRGGDCALQSR